MSLNKNNNGKTIYRIAKNNLMAKKMSSFFAGLSILLAIALVSTLSLFIAGTQTAEKNTLEHMQHVMYRNVTDEQLQKMTSDSRMERCDPYKELEKTFQSQNIKYCLSYYGNYAESQEHYVSIEGKDPEHYHEILVDKAFMKALGKEAVIGERIDLDIDGETQPFIVSGYTDKNTPVTTHFIHVSKAFAEQSPFMKDLPYTALVRINDITGVPASAFTTIAYQIAMDYKIERPNVNLNGKFEHSLQRGNSGIYTVLFVSAILFIASSIVIYSIFYLSVTARVQQIGQLQTIGMTEKQVKQMIRRELLLSILSIPIGLLIGGIVSHILIPDGWTLKNYGILSLVIGILGILIVQFSVRKPAKIASKFSPIEASKNAGASAKERPNDKHKTLTLYVLAQMESKNNRKRWWFTTVSLALGGTIFMVAVTWIASWNEEQYAREGTFTNGEYYISYLYDHNTPKPYGITEFQLTGHLGSELKHSIQAIPNVKNVHIEKAASGDIEYKGVTFLQAFYPLRADDTEYYQLPAKGNNSYEYMAEHNAVLITDSTFSENINGITFEPGDKIKLRYFDGEEHTVELEIAAVSAEGVKGTGNRPNFCMADKTIEKLWHAMNTAAEFFISVENYEKNGEQVENALRTLLNGYEDLSLDTLRERKIEASAQIDQIQMQIYGIAIFIILFSIFNLINTVISSIISRKKELSMFESIGMEERQICNMLFWESFLLALPNILITLTFGTITGFAFISYMQKSASYLEYHFPIPAVVLYLIGIIGIPMLISLGCLKRQNNISLVERIRSEN